MRARLWMVAATALVLPLAAGCSGGGEQGVNSASSQATMPSPEAGSGPTTTGGAPAESDDSSGGGLIPSLINVDLRNVLNDLAVRLNLDRANVPINAQIPITLAVNVCGVSINVLAVSTGGQANCTAKTSSPELAQVVQQQLAAGGSVGGGAQGGSTAGTSTTATTGGSSTAGATGTSAQSSGTSETSGTASPTPTDATPDTNPDATQPQ